MVHLNLVNSTLENAVSTQPSGLVELLPCPALLYAGEGAILAANRLFREQLGYTADELAQRRVVDITDQQDRQRDEAVRDRLSNKQDSESRYEKRWCARSAGSRRTKVN